MAVAMNNLQDLEDAGQAAESSICIDFLRTERQTAGPVQTQLGNHGN